MNISRERSKKTWALIQWNYICSLAQKAYKCWNYEHKFSLLSKIKMLMDFEKVDKLATKKLVMMLDWINLYFYMNNMHLLKVYCL